jgi:rhamnosyltransferase
MHAVVIPLYGELPSDHLPWTESLLREGFKVVFVDNNPATAWHPCEGLPVVSDFSRDGVATIGNRNAGGVAGGFNRGVEFAIQHGAHWITLLDQDSRIKPGLLSRLREPWQEMNQARILVGPQIWDGRRGVGVESEPSQTVHGYAITRLLISSGTTFRSADWNQLGSMNEWLTIDYVDHAWCFQAQARMGFLLLQHPEVKLVQQFGALHPNRFCRWLGMELYSPMRHFYQLRNLRWLIRQSFVPIDLRCKELVKMLIKPWLWILFEPKKRQNLSSILQALQAPLPVDGGFG